MRNRIVALLIVPIACILLGLGAVLAHGIAVTAFQRAYLEQLGDVSRLVPAASLAIGANEVASLQSTLDRYGEVYGVGAAVIARDGSVLVGNAEMPRSDDAYRTSARAALAGRHSVAPGFRWPWSGDPLTVAEPVSSAGDVVAAVVTVSGGDAAATYVMLWWVALTGGAALSITGAFVIAGRLARWILRPVGELAGALGAVGDGRLAARIPTGAGPPELRRLVTAFNDMAGKVEAAVEHQRAFVANASHELRNPLNALLLRVDELGMALPATAQPEYEAAREEGARLTRLLDALLLLAGGEASQFVTGPVDLAAMVRHRVGALTALAAGRGVHLRADATGPVWGDADDLALESALDAVIDNSCKFSPRGTSVLVSARLDDGEAVVAVRDHGPGMDDRDLSRATERFWRSPAHQNLPGSGLGLAIASTFTRVCGGRLDLASPPGGGLLVTLRVPARAEEPV